MSLSPTQSSPARRALITGGKGDLAQCLTHALHCAGYEVLAPGRDSLDVQNPKQIQRFFSTLPSLDLLVLNAAITRDKPLKSLSSDDWDHVLDCQLGGAFRITQAALPALLRGTQPHLVGIGSFSAKRPPIGQVAYAAAKAGLEGFIKSIAREYGHKNLRSNLILPGFLQTRMTAPLSADRLQQVRTSHCLPDFNSPAAVAAFLLCLDQQLPHTSGQVFSLDSRIF